MTQPKTSFARFKALQEGRKGKKDAKAAWFKFEETNKAYTIRFLPLKNENGELPITVQHYHAVNYPDGTFATIVCPKRAGSSDTCPFCAEASRLWKKFADTQDEKIKAASKALFARSQYLMVGYEPNKIDPANLSAQDVKIFKISSQANQATIDNKLGKGIDFPDFQTGRNVEMTKAPGQMDVITLDFCDPEPAFAGRKDAEALWNQLYDLSPDLTPYVQVPTPAEIQAAFDKFCAAPVVDDPPTSPAVNVERPKPSPVASRPSPVSTTPEVGISDADLLDLQRSIDED